MSAQVSIAVAREAEALLVPIQAVVERAGRHFAAILQSDGATETREVTIGHVNEEAVVILDGLSAGENVILTPSLYEEHLDFPTEESLASNEKIATLPHESLIPKKDSGTAKAAAKDKSKNRKSPKPGKTEVDKRS